MTNVFKDKETLGNELVRFHRQHAGWRTDRFLKNLLAPHLLKLMGEAKKAEPEKKEEKKGKKK